MTVAVQNAVKIVAPINDKCYIRLGFTNVILNQRALAWRNSLQRGFLPGTTNQETRRIC